VANRYRFVGFYCGKLHEAFDAVGRAEPNSNFGRRRIVIGQRSHRFPRLGHIEVRSSGDGRGFGRALGGGAGIARWQRRNQKVFERNAPHWTWERSQGNRLLAGCAFKGSAKAVTVTVSGGQLVEFIYDNGNRGFLFPRGQTL